MKFRDRTEIIASLIQMGEAEREEVETATKKAFRFRSVRRPERRSGRMKGRHQDA
jgi:hypothetical protein